LPPFSVAVHCAAKKGVTNGGTIVRCTGKEKGNGQEIREGTGRWRLPVLYHWADREER
jgi:hypothetical protein